MILGELFSLKNIHKKMWDTEEFILGYFRQIKIKKTVLTFTIFLLIRPLKTNYLNF